MKKFLRLLLKSILVILSLLVIVFIVLKLTYNEEVPEGIPGQAADVLAQQMLDALKADKFQSAQEIQWTFRGKTTYHWQLQQGIVEVFWEDYHVTYHTKDVKQSKAMLNALALQGTAKEDAIAYAVAQFNNDSFWLVAPFKVFDKGVLRSIVEVDGKQKLLLQYTTGGTTPGDAYLWDLDKNYRPVAFKMWVSILPFDGIEAQWSEWDTTAGGFMLAKSRTFFGLEIPISDVKVVP